MRYRSETTATPLLAYDFFFELSIATIDFSAHELRLRRWQAHLDDIIWAKLMDAETGIYSDSFLRSFSAELAPLGKQYSTLASKVYRECSEYVHGNLNTHPGPDTPLEFSETLTLAWAEKAKTIRRCITFAFSARFLAFLPVQNRNIIEPVVLDVWAIYPPSKHTTLNPEAGMTEFFSERKISDLTRSLNTLSKTSRTAR